jgi:hypothetical protein
MTLSSVVLSRDWQEVSVLECILGGLQIDVAIEKEPRKALERLGKSKVDALIVDCDLNGSSQFLRELQSSDKRQGTVPLVIMGGQRHTPSLDATGALFAFEKPISVDQAVRTFTAARSMILDGRLRYHRVGLEVPVFVKSVGRKVTKAELVNISQGGMLIHTAEGIDSATCVQISFVLPGSRAAVKAQAKVAWHDNGGNYGIRFIKVATRQERTLELWLAQQFLAN